jgi:hypothetical protein
MFSGRKALECEVYPNMPTHDRCDVNIYISDMPEISNEYYVDSMIKVRADYDLTNPHDDASWNPWHEIADLFSEWDYGVPYYYMPLHVGKNLDGFMLSLSLIYAPNDGTENTIIWKFSSSVNLPRGESFHLRYYVFRHPTDGLIKVWIDNTLVFNISEKPTMFREEYFTTPAKLYGGEILPEKKLWLDKLTIFDHEPH